MENLAVIARGYDQYGHDFVRWEINESPGATLEMVMYEIKDLAKVPGVVRITVDIALPMK